MQMISLVLNLVFGSGLFIQFFQIKNIKSKGAAEVKSNELDNVQEAVKIWREMAEALNIKLAESITAQQQMATKYAEMTVIVETFKKDIAKLTSNINKMMKMLDSITPENITQTVEQIKKLHETK